MAGLKLAEHEDIKQEEIRNKNNINGDLLRLTLKELNTVCIGLILIALWDVYIYIYTLIY